MNRLLSYFFSGVLIVLPLAATVYLLSLIIRNIDGWIPVSIPGLGFIIVIVALTLIGYMGSGFLARPILGFIDTILARTPVVSVIYSSLKDLIEAFVGDKKKFEAPVLVDISGNETFRVGFITQKDGTGLTLPDHVGVYIPHSYNFSGNFYLVPKNRIKQLNIPAGQIMRFAVSGGVVNLE